MKTNSKSIVRYIFFLVVVFSTLVIFQVRNLTYFVILESVVVLLNVIVRRKLFFLPDRKINIIYLLLCVSLLNSYLFSSLPNSFKRGALVQFIILIPLWLIAAYIYNECKTDNKIIEYANKALKIMCCLQFIWCVFQFGTYAILKVDINDQVFVQILGLVNNASFFKYKILQPSGFSWHPSTLAPLVVLGFFLFSSPYMKILCIITALLSRNGTAIIGIGLALFVSIIELAKKRNKRIPKMYFLPVLIIFVVGCVLFLCTNIFDSVISQIVSLISRMLTSTAEISAMEHKRYYSSYPLIIKNSTVLQTLLGYGEGCSGYPFTQLYGQALSYSSWSVESDFINILISRGVFGFVAFYSFLTSAIWKGIKVNKKYGIVLSIFLLQGITYNIQTDGVFLLKSYYTVL